MPKEHVAIFALLCVIAFGAGYWHSESKVDSDERVEVVAPPAPPTVVTNVVTNTLKEVVTNIVTSTPQPTPTPTPAPVKPRPQPANIVAATLQELTKADSGKVTVLYLVGEQLTEVKGLEKLTQLNTLYLHNNPDLTKAQIAELQKALPKCDIYCNLKK